MHTHKQKTKSKKAMNKKYFILPFEVKK